MNRVEQLFVDHLLELAEEADGDPDVLTRAMDHIERVWPFVRDDADKLFRLIWAVGLFLRYQGFGDTFLEWAGRGREVARATGDRLTEGQLLNNMGLVLAERGEIAEALRRYEEALEIHEALHDDAEIAATLHNLGLLQIDFLGDAPRALSYFRSALDHVVLAGERAGEAAVRSSLAAAEEVLGDLEKALGDARKALEIREELGLSTAIGTSLNQIGGILLDLGDPDAALEQFLRALPLREAAGHRKGIAETLDNIGVAHFHKGEYEQALRFYRAAVETAQEIGDRSGLAAIFSNIAYLHLERGDLEAAERYLARALELGEVVGNRSRRGTVLGYLGLLRGRNGDFDTGLRFVRESLAIAEETSDTGAQATALGYLGSLLHQAGNLAEAADAYGRALHIRYARADHHGVATVLRELGLLLKDAGEPIAGESAGQLAAAVAAARELPTDRECRDVVDRVRAITGTQP